MKRKEFPMSDKYNEQAAKLLELLEVRDKINKQLEFMTPEQRRQVIKDSAELDKKIEGFEELIAVHYEAYQLQRLLETEMEKIDARQFVRIQKMYIYIKHRAPQEKLDEFVEIINILPPEDRELFYDQAAILEATELDKILGEPKPE
jgi:soluble cytochrome b562